MARFEDGCYGSLKGITLIGKVLAGRCQMHYTRVAAGKGEIPEDLTPKALTEPPEYVMDAMISSVTNPVDGECQVSVQINSAHVENGFYCTWLVLYAEDPDEGEVPFTALCLENEPEWIRPSSSIVGKLAHFDLIAAVGDVDKVSATIDPDALVTLESVQQLISEHSRDPEAHQDIRRAIEGMATGLDITIPKTGWVAAGLGKYKYRQDIPVAEAAARMIPQLTVLPTGEDTALGCGLCPAAEALDGALRVYAVTVPVAPIAAKLVLTDPAAWLAGGDGGTGWPSLTLPVATTSQPGAVKPGSGLRISSDGTLSVDTATDEEVKTMLDELEKREGKQ